MCVCVLVSQIAFFHIHAWSERCAWPPPFPVHATAMVPLVHTPALLLSIACASEAAFASAAARASTDADADSAAAAADDDDDNDNDDNDDDAIISSPPIAKKHWSFACIAVVGETNSTRI